MFVINPSGGSSLSLRIAHCSSSPSVQTVSIWPRRCRRGAQEKCTSICMILPRGKVRVSCSTKSFSNVKNYKRGQRCDNLHSEQSRPFEQIRKALTMSYPHWLLWDNSVFHLSSRILWRTPRRFYGSFVD